MLPLNNWLYFDIKSHSSCLQEKTNFFGVSFFSLCSHCFLFCVVAIVMLLCRHF